MAELGKVLDDEDIIFNEAVTNTPAVLMQIPRRVAQHRVQHQRRRARLVRRHGARRQARGAEPDDGAGRRRRRLLFLQSRRRCSRLRSNTACRFSSIVLDNSGWSAVKQSTLRVYPDGDASIANEFEAELAPKVEFGKVAEAFGAYAEKVSRPGRGAGRHRALRQGSPRRPHRAAARESHADVTFRTPLMPERKRCIQLREAAGIVRPACAEIERSVAARSTPDNPPRPWRRAAACRRAAH